MSPTAEATMARPKGRPKKPTGEGSPVRIDSDIVAKARYLAATKDIPIAEYLSGILRPVVEREFIRAGRALLKEDE